MIRDEAIEHQVEVIDTLINVHGWEKTALAKEIGVTYATLHKWVGKKHKPGASSFKKLICLLENPRGEGTRWQKTQLKKLNKQGFIVVEDGRFAINKKGETKRLAKNWKYESAPINITGSRKRYRTTSYTKDGIQEHYYIHHFVAKAFVEKQPHQSQVIFIDGNQDNVSAENLRWATPKERYGHARKLNRKERNK